MTIACEPSVVIKTPTYHSRAPLQTVTVRYPNDVVEENITVPLPDALNWWTISQNGARAAS